MSSPMVVSSNVISSAAALQLVGHCVTAAERRDKHMSITVCDPEGGLCAFLRMDGAPLLSRDMSQNKAYTAVLLGISSADWYEFIKDSPALSLGLPHFPGFVAIDGGYPIKSGDNTIGGLGVSGGSHEDDAACAKEALAAMASVL